MESFKGYKNKEKRREYLKNYRKENKNELREFIKCDICGLSYKKNNKWHHFNTKKHKFIEMEEKLKNIEKLIKV